MTGWALFAALACILGLTAFLLGRRSMVREQETHVRAAVVRREADAVDATADGVARGEVLATERDAAFDAETAALVEVALEGKPASLVDDPTVLM